MTERPILFSAPMVRALLDGRKTQTRRVVKPQPVSVGTRPLVSFSHGTPEWSFGLDDQDARGLKWWRCPYGVVGDRLWVRESWQADVEDGPRKPAEIAAGRPFFYAAGGSRDAGALAVRASGWRPSIHMPRWASRITLNITDVRVEQLNDISHADAAAEGLLTWKGRDCDGDPRLDGRMYEFDAWGWKAPEHEADGFWAPVAAYRDLWNHINGPESWAANPWVWAVSFEVVR